MPETTVVTIAYIVILIACTVACIWIALRINCRERARIEAKEKREAAERLATMISLRRAYSLDNLPPASIRPHPLRTSPLKTPRPWVIPPASFTEADSAPQISTTDTPDGDARTRADVLTLCLPADTADTPK